MGLCISLQKEKDPFQSGYKVITYQMNKNEKNKNSISFNIPITSDVNSIISNNNLKKKKI
jgi:hypothetical protein